MPESVDAAPAAPAVPAVSLYRRPLPTQCTALDSPAGKQMFAASFNSGHAEPFLPLVSQFTTQSEPAFCGPGTLAMVLNALELDPGRQWKGPWRWFSEELLDCCLPLEVIATSGITLDDFVCLAHCNGADALLYQTSSGAASAEACGDFSLDDFRSLVVRHCSGDDARRTGFMVLSYARSVLGQTGGGHFSPLAAYDPQTDRALLLDVARFKYAPHWVQLRVLYEAMKPLDSTTGRPRGLVIVRLPEAAQHADGSSDKRPPAAAAALCCGAAKASMTLQRPEIVHVSRVSADRRIAAHALERAMQEVAAASADELRSPQFLLGVWQRTLAAHFKLTPLVVQENLGPGAAAAAASSTASTSQQRQKQCGCANLRQDVVDAVRRVRMSTGAGESRPAPHEAVTAAALLELAARRASRRPAVAETMRDAARHVMSNDDVATAELTHVADVFDRFV